MMLFVLKALISGSVCYEVVRGVATLSVVSVFLFFLPRSAVSAIGSTLVLSLSQLSQSIYSKVIPTVSNKQGRYPAEMVQRS